MKRVMLIIALVGLCFGLTGCGSKNSNSYFDRKVFTLTIPKNIGTGINPAASARLATAMPTDFSKVLVIYNNEEFRNPSVSGSNLVFKKALADEAMAKMKQGKAIAATGLYLSNLSVFALDASGKKIPEPVLDLSFTPTASANNEIKVVQQMGGCVIEGKTSGDEYVKANHAAAIICQYNQNKKTATVIVYDRDGKNMEGLQDCTWEVVIKGKTINLIKTISSEQNYVNVEFNSNLKQYNLSLTEAGKAVVKDYKVADFEISKLSIKKGVELLTNSNTQIKVTPLLLEN